MGPRKVDDIKYRVAGKTQHQVEVKSTVKETPWIIPLVVLMIIFILNCVIGFTFLEEDAFIDFRYAANMANGDGFVFNPGGEKVEGFSNFLWLGILYLLRAAGLKLVVGARLTGILLGLGTIALCYFTTSRITGREGYINFLPSAMIAFSPPLIYWYQGGLESALFSFLLLLAIYLHIDESDHIRGTPYSGFICFLLALTRPEGILFFIIFAILKARPALRESDRLGPAIVWFFMCFIPFLLFIAARYTIFESIVPNTYYAKVNYTLADALNTGKLYTTGFFLDSRAWIWLIPFILVLFRSRGVPLWRQTLPLILFLSYSAFVLYVGGDFHIYYRFYAPLLPLLFISAGSGLWAIHDIMMAKGTRVSAGLAIMVIAMVVIVISCVYHRSPAWRDLNKVGRYDRSFLSYRYQRLAENPKLIVELADAWADPPGDILMKAGHWLRDNYPEDTTLATEQCGKVPYITQFETYDMLGLNSKKTARIIHYKLGFDNYLAEFENAEADIVLLYYTDGKFVDKQHIGKLVDSPEFQSKYILKKILDFDYIYNLDRVYHRPRRMLLFERRKRAATVTKPAPVAEIVDGFIEKKGDAGRVSFVVEL